MVKLTFNRNKTRSGSRAAAHSYITLIPSSSICSSQTSKRSSTNNNKVYCNNSKNYRGNSTC